LVLLAGTDYFVAELVAEAVANRMDGLVLPELMAGITPMHMPFEGPDLQ